MKLISALILTAASLMAQTDKPAEPANFYRLDLVVKENEAGKTINSRSYFMEISSAPPFGSNNSSIRTGSKVPVPGKDGAYSYIDVGINFDCRFAKETGDQLSLNVQADINTVAEPASNPPVIRNTRWAGNVTVPLRKPTIIFASDDALSKRQMQLELTATPIK
jgi:hypothetical protein